MKNFAKYHKKCRLAALSALIIATHKDVDKEVDGEFYTIEDIARDTHRYADAMVAYEKGQPLQESQQVQLIYPEVTFNMLRQANIDRLPTFKNKHGELAHSQVDGSDWSPAQWLQAVLGELGEYANLRKKFERGDVSADEFKIEAAKELADVQIYLDILAFQLGINLGEATLSKFNEVSIRVGSPIRLSHYHYQHARVTYVDSDLTSSNAKL